MTYERSLPLQGGTSSVMNLAVVTFAGSGLRITGRTASSISIEGSGVRRTSHGLLGTLSRGEVRVENGSVTLRAEFDGMRRLPLVFGIVFAVVVTGLAVILGLFWMTGLMPWYLPWVVVPPLAVWLVIVPLMLRYYRQRVEHELDTLLHNLTMAGSVPDAAIAAPMATAQ